MVTTCSQHGAKMLPDCTKEGLKKQRECAVAVNRIRVHVQLMFDKKSQNTIKLIIKTSIAKKYENNAKSSQTETEIDAIRIQCPNW